MGGMRMGNRREVRMAEEKDVGIFKESLAASAVGKAGGTMPLPPALDGKAEKRVEKAVEASQKSVVTREKPIGEAAENLKGPVGPVGLDIGTSHIIVAQNKLRDIHLTRELNAFFTVPVGRFSRQILNQKEIHYYELEDLFYVIGYSAQNFANMFNMNTRRPMRQGVLSPIENEGMRVIQEILKTLIGKPRQFGETLCFGVPGDPIGKPGAVIYHESMLKRVVGNLGYTPISVNEGMAIVLSELSRDDFTGIGISMGGGMCNVCLSYLSFPVITYSIQMAGDYIDAMVENAVGEPATKVKEIKEETLDLSAAPRDRVSTALHIFYDKLIRELLESLQRVLSFSDQIPKISTPIPIVLSGGTAMPNGCREKFATMLKDVSLPVEISEVRLAEDPLVTTAKGALIMAMTEAG